MTQAPSITLHLAPFGWQAAFENILSMPDRTWVPLPFTPAAPIDTVAADMARRFPKATLYVIRSTGTYHV
jgi:hypothetical protein